MKVWRAVVVGAALLGCREDLTPPTADATADAPDADVGIDAAPDAAPREACDGGAAEACNSEAISCGDGFLYRCFGGGTCPVADAGGCSFVSNDPLSRVTEVCCDRLACTRMQFLDTRCKDQHDSGAYKGWSCPWRNGAQMAKAPGVCTLYGTPAPGATSTSGDYCCR